MSPFLFIVGALACYRLTVLVSRDKGPFGIFAKLRSLDKGTSVLKCPYCSSVWLAGFVCLVLHYFAGVIDTGGAWFCILFAFSAISICLDRVFTSDHLQK